MNDRRDLIIQLVVFVFMLGLVPAVPAWAVTHYVSPGQSIQSAIDASSNGDEIEVAPGTYNEAIDFKGKAVRLYSSGGADVTTIDATGLNSSVVQCISGEDANTILDGFTITGGNANGTYPYSSGGGMYNDYSSPTVTDCNFISNYADNTGGGMHNRNNSSPTVTNCTFTGNVAHFDGGGMYNNKSSPTVTNCTFLNNAAIVDFGGGMCNAESSPTVTNCTFSGNSAGYEGGGMCNPVSSPTVTNCILWGNIAPTGPQIDGGSPTVTYSDVQGGWSGTGNINANPLFVDAAGGDFRLSSAASPCVDAGDNSAPGLPATDLAGNPRVVDGDVDSIAVVDMGVFEFYGPGVRNVTKGQVYATIQSAIDDANNGDEILVAPGTYNEAINFNGKALRLYSSGGPEVTTIDGTRHDHVVQCVNGEEANTILEGFTITGGNANGDWPHDSGGGMYNNNSSPTVTNCIFRSNTAEEGGGIYNLYSSPTVTNCIFTSNSVGFGGGMYNWSSSPTVINCTFENNTARASGGGMYNNEISSPTVTNCIFTSNSAFWGGGMCNNGSSPTVTNCTFIGNSADYQGGGMCNNGISPTVTNCTFIGNSSDYQGGGMCNNVSSPTVTNCILWGNIAPTGPQIDGGSPTVTYSDVQRGYAGTGNIDADPNFVDANNPDPNLVDLRLMPVSPCIDAADSAALLPMPYSAIDLDGNIRFVDVSSITNTGSGPLEFLDMGAYEYPCNWSEGDINCDGVVDFKDLAILCANWLSGTEPEL